MIKRISHNEVLKRSWIVLATASFAILMARVAFDIKGPKIIDSLMARLLPLSVPLAIAVIFWISEGQRSHKETSEHTVALSEEEEDDIIFRTI